MMDKDRSKGIGLASPSREWHQDCCCMQSNPITTSGTGDNVFCSECGRAYEPVGSHWHYVDGIQKVRPPSDREIGDIKRQRNDCLYDSEQIKER